MNSALTMAEPMLRIRDNAMLVAQARRRMRMREAGPTLAIVAVLGLFAVMACLGATDRNMWTAMRGALLGLVALLLYLRAPALLISALATERETGILDFHRATPMTPLSQAVGYLFGCTAREWAGAAVALPFWAFIVVGSERSLALDLVGVGYIALGAVLVQVMALWLGLAGGSQARRSAGTTGALLVAIVWILAGLWSAGFVTPGHLTPFPALVTLGSMELAKQPVGARFFGVEVSSLWFTLLVQGHAVAFLLWGSMRKLRRDSSPSLSRPGALAFLASVGVLILGGNWDALAVPRGAGDAMDNAGGFAAMWLAGGTMLAVILCVVITPQHLDALRAMRRATSLGRTRPGVLEDGAATLPVTAGMVAVIGAGLSLLVVGTGSALELDVLLGPPVWLALAASAALCAFVSGAAEYSMLAQRRSYRAAGMLIVFLCVGVPWMAAGLALLADAKELAPWLGSLSPASVGGAWIDLARSWNDANATLSPGLWSTSLATTTALAAWFHWRVHGIRAEMVRGTPRS
ncbi:MAG: hypothetical protein HY904_20645 [Deltaproteobacteria bacterium]|nr:hypothetical protein [Deltaproteobacteria bacterium]